MPTARMSAAAIRGPGSIGTRRVRVPEPAPGDVRVRVEACGICGSDLHLFRSGLFPPERIPGHEFVGVIDALGDGVAGLAAGERVAVEPFRSCGGCAACRAGRDPICREARLLGLQEDGGLAEYVVVPAGRLFRLPSPLDPSLAALAEPTAVVVHGLRRGALAPGQRVLVLGAGAIGLLTVAAARALGAGEVWGTARHAHQAKRALDLGAHRVLGEREATPERLADLGRAIDFDLVVETVGGRADTLRAAGAAVRPGGAISILGVFAGSVELDPLPLLLKDATLAWSYCYCRGEEQADFDAALAFLAAEQERIEPLVTHRVPLGEVERAFAVAADKRAGAVKVSVIP